MIPVLLIVSILVFFMTRLIPGDPVYTILGMDADPQEAEAMRERLGLNDPLPLQYLNYMKNLARGDLGSSIKSQRPVMSEIKSRYPITLKLSILATIFSTTVGMLMGIVSAVNRSKFSDNLLMVISLVSVSAPIFFVGFLLMLLFSLKLGWLPSVGASSSLHYILPSIALGSSAVGMIARTTRSSMLDVLSQDYIRTSRSRGIKRHTIIYSHALKNALIPVITLIGLRFGSLLAGATLTETVFSINGLGRLLVQGVLDRDYPVVQGCVLILAATFITINTIVDVLYGVIDPRVKYE